MTTKAVKRPLRKAAKKAVQQQAVAEDSMAAALALAQDLGAALKQSSLSCVTAESCTGGLLASAITSCAGSSAWFDSGFVTYSNSAKISQLGVGADCLQQYGAVSEQTARAMAEGALQVTPGAGLALSTTGIAGPGGGTDNKPVGMVCFGVAVRTERGIEASAFTEFFSGNRAQVRALAVCFALLAGIKTLLS